MRYGKIYKATNKKNKKVYIGQTLSDLEQRKKNHMKSCKNDNVKDKFHIELRKIGLEGFDWEIIEESIPINKLNEKEKFYIKKYDSFKNGYNSNSGFSVDTKYYTEKYESKVNDIIETLKTTNLTQKEIAKKFNVTVSTVSDINCGESWFIEGIEYPIRKSFNAKIHFDEETIKEMYAYLKKTKSFKLTAEKFNCCDMTVRKINKGIEHAIDGYEYPIIDKFYDRLDNEKIIKIVNKLKNTDLTQQEIADELNIQRKAVSTINTGKYHKKDIIKLFPNIEFPIRN